MIKRISLTFACVIGVVVAWIVGLVTYVFISLHFPELLVLILGALTVIAGVAFLFGIVVFRLTRVEYFGKAALLYGVVSAAIPAVLLLTLEIHDRTFRGLPAPNERLAVALKAASVPVPDAGTYEEYAALEEIAEAFGSARVVALGEATHGTAEFFDLKHRVVRHLVEHKGFRHFAMEVHPEHTGPTLNDYIQGREVDPTSVLYWPWGTEEYLELLRWLRAFNRDRLPEARVVLHGIDPVFENRDRGMADNVMSILEDDPTARIVVWAANSHVHATAGGMGQWLKERLDDDVYLLGLEFGGGRFSSRFGAIHEYVVGPFPSSYFSYPLLGLSGDVRFLDFRPHDETSLIGRWLREPRFTNAMYEAYTVARLWPSQIPYFSHRVRAPITDRFDGLLVVRESTPPRPMVTGVFPPDRPCEWSGGDWQRSGNGLWYQKSGSGPTVVLIHGAGLDSRMWNAEAGALARSYTVVRYDLRGFGRSTEHGDYPSSVDDLLGLLDELEVDRAHLVGLSFGGGIAIEFALTHPDRVLSVVAAAPSVGGQPVPREASEPFGPPAAAWAAGNPDEAMSLWLETPAVKLNAAESTEAAECVTVMVALNLATVLEPTRQWRALSTSSWERLESLEPPLLLLAGDEEAPFLLSNMRTLATRASGAELFKLDGGVGHLLNIDAPDAFIAELRRFLMWTRDRSDLGVETP